MKYFQKKKQLKQIYSDINDLCLYKKTLKSVGSFFEGLSYLNNQFDMTEYTINNLNRSLSMYLGKEDCLSECLELLYKLQDEYIKERKVQKEQFNEINALRETHKMEKCMLTTDSEAFIYNYHRAINQIQEIAHNTVVKCLMQFNNKIVNDNYKTYINKNDLKTLQSNNQLYSLLFALENNLRKYILVKYQKIYNDTSLSKWLKQDQLNDYSKRKEEENKFGISSRGDNIIYYLDFDDLGNIIQNKFKEGFDDEFKRIDDIVPKLKYLYLIRCKIAHNSLTITSDEIKMAEVYILHILRIIFRRINKF